MPNKEKILKELCADQPCKKGGDYCILKEVLLHDAKYNERLLTQVGCVNKYKYQESQRRGEDIGWSEAWSSWVESGMASLFAKHYECGDSVAKMYKKLLTVSNE